jgi:hypothetical protein
LVAKELKCGNGNMATESEFSTIFGWIETTGHPFLRSYLKTKVKGQSEKAGIYREVL